MPDDDQATGDDVGGTTPSDVGVAGDPLLLADGWTRRSLTAPDRVDEFRELYESMGLEVLAQSLAPADFGAKCKSCAVSACTSYVMLYTRKR